jgi:hypothetical protein
VESASRELSEWWHEVGARARDESGLQVEINVQRYRHALTPIVVRIDETFSRVQANYLTYVAEVTGATILLSAGAQVNGVSNLTRESVNELVARSAIFDKVRWLSHEFAPVEALLENGTSTDRRPLAQAGAIEGPRWLLEQSVSMTSQRYGNVNAGPKPVCRGLGVADVGARVVAPRSLEE